MSALDLVLGVGERAVGRLDSALRLLLGLSSPHELILASQLAERAPGVRERRRSHRQRRRPTECRRPERSDGPAHICTHARRARRRRARRAAAQNGAAARRLLDRCGRRVATSKETHVCEGWRRCGDQAAGRRDAEETKSAQRSTPESSPPNRGAPTPIAASSTPCTAFGALPTAKARNCGDKCPSSKLAPGARQLTARLSAEV